MFQPMIGDWETVWWNVTIRETLGVVAVEAEDAYAAEDIVWNRYRTGEIVLEADDFSDVKIDAEEAGEPSPRPFSMGREAFDQTL